VCRRGKLEAGGESMHSMLFLLNESLCRCSVSVWPVPGEGLTETCDTGKQTDGFFPGLYGICAFL
jgi:hypothetical protein